MVALNTVTVSCEPLPNGVITKPIIFRVGNQPHCITLWGIGDNVLQLWRLAGKCDQYTKQVPWLDCFEDGCPVMILKPAKYVIRWCDNGDDMPEGLWLESYVFSDIEHARLICEHKGGVIE